MGLATPLGDPIAVSDFGGSVTDVNLELTGLSHTYPDDIDMLLVAPGGENAIVMSDAGGLPPQPRTSLSRSTTRPAQRCPITARL